MTVQTINCAGAGGNAARVHRAHEDDPSKTAYLFPICEGGAIAAKQGRINYEQTDRDVNCGNCLDILAAVA